MGFKLIGMGHGICFGQCEQFHTILCNPLLPPAKKYGQGNIFRSECQEFCSPGGLPHCMLGYTPWDQRQAPPGPEAGIPRSRHPPEQTPPTRSRHPPAQCMLGDRGNKRAVRTKLECNLVYRSLR